MWYFVFGIAAWYAVASLVVRLIPRGSKCLGPVDNVPARQFFWLFSPVTFTITFAFDVLPWFSGKILTPRK